jgi:hypothetical protein
MTFLAIYQSLHVFIKNLIHIVSKRHLDGPLINEHNINTFRESISEINWSNRLNGLDVNDSNEYAKIFEACFPMERIKCKSLQNNNSPLSYKQLINLPNKQRESRYKTYKNKLTHVIRNAKRTYYENSPFILNETNVHELEEICHGFQAGKAPAGSN